MSDKYKIREPDKAYFVTMTIVQWIDVFSRPIQKKRLFASLQHCQQNKGLIIYAYCLMSSHLHMICQADEGHLLTNILRDFKTFTSKQIIQTIQEEPESRREWMLSAFHQACDHLKRKQRFKVWQDGNHAKELFSNHFIWQKLDYIHANPVKDLIVSHPENYLYSSARNYAELDSMLDVVMLSRPVKTS
ncbi:MAG: transposase [Flavobacteriales bacterium]|nr:transposase [Flavobacteriales bacterium]